MSIFLPALNVLLAIGVVILAYIATALEQG